LWRALLQITRMTPLRLMILQFSQSFLTDARTFINSDFRIHISKFDSTHNAGSTASTLPCDKS
jgi:hypothetical protein